MSRELHIATRKSMLALWQAQTIQKLLSSHGIQASLLPLVTTGDKMQKSQLADIQLQQNNGAEHHLTTGKGLFIKEIQESILSGKAQIAVHSMKDLPITQTKDLSIVSLLPRAGARDVLILSPQVLEETKLNLLTEDEKQKLEYQKLKEILLKSKIFCEKEIGTTSTRRQMLLRKSMSKNLNIQILRGNVDTRLKRLRNNEFSAIILAEAGLERLGLFHKQDMFYLPITEFIPATAQGVIAVEIAENDLELSNQVSNINCKKTCLSAGLERMVLALLGGDCHSSIGVHYHNEELFIICGRDGIHKETKLKVNPHEVVQIEKILEECHFIFSHFFDQLCHSPFAKNTKSQLIALGYLEVSDLKSFYP